MINASNAIANFYISHKRWTRVIITIFLVGIVLGGVTGMTYPDLMEQIQAGFADKFGESPALDMNLALDIFIQNLTASLIAWLGGLILGVLPVLVVLFNGFILGYVVVYIATSGESIFFTSLLLTAGLVPHGIFELPAFLLAAILGMRLGLDWLSGNARGLRFATLRQSFLQTSKYFIVVVVALALAAVIEVFVSGKIVGN